MVRGENEVHEAQVRLLAGPLHGETELGFAVLKGLSSAQHGFDSAENSCPPTGL